MKRKNLLTILIAACLSLCLFGGLSAAHTKAKAAPTVQETTITQITVDEKYGFWLKLSDNDYGNTTNFKGNNYDPIKTLNTLNKIQIDGNYIANDNSEIGSSKGDPYINLFGKLAGSFRLSNIPKSQVIIEKGCQFPSYDYWNGNADGVIYEIKETVTYKKNESGAWVAVIPENDISDTFSATVTGFTKDSIVITLATTADIAAPDGSGKWLMDNMTELQNYITINEKTVAEINEETDDSSYVYTEFPGTLNGVYAVPLRILFKKNGNKSEFNIYIHNDYFSVLSSEFSVGIKPGFTRANTAATVNMTVKTTVSLNMKKSNADAVLSDGLIGGAFDSTEGYYHAYLYTDLFKGNSGIGYGIIDNNSYKYIANYICINGQSVADINKNTDITDWKWVGFPYTAADTYHVPVMLYVSTTEEVNASKGETRLEFRIHKNYIDLVNGDITVTIKKGLYVCDSKNNAIYTVANDISGAIYYKSYALTINVEGKDPTVLQLKHTAPIDLTNFCTEKEGYTFSGWFTDAELKTEAIDNTMPASDYAVYGKYTAIEYTAKLILADKSEHDLTYTIENRAEKLAEAKALLGNDDAQYAYANDLPEELPPENDKTYTESRTVKEYDVKIGDAETIKVPYGEKLTKPADPVKTKEGYTITFDGWYNGETKWNFDSDTVTENVTLVAKFTETVNRYTVTINFVGIEKNSVKLTVEYGKTVDFTVYAEEGYSFTVKNGDEEITELTVAGDVTLTITYIEKAPEESGNDSEKQSDNESIIESDSDNGISATESGNSSESGNGDNSANGGCFGSVSSSASVIALTGLVAMLVFFKKKNK